MSSETEDISLKMVGLELMFLTPEKYSHEDGITAVELAKLVELPLEVVKKKLQILKDKNIVRVKELIPNIGFLMNTIFNVLMMTMIFFICCVILKM